MNNRSVKSSYTPACLSERIPKEMTMPSISQLVFSLLVLSISSVYSIQASGLTPLNSALSINEPSSQKFSTHESSIRSFDPWYENIRVMTFSNHKEAFRQVERYRITQQLDTIEPKILAAKVYTLLYDFNFSDMEPLLKASLDIEIAPRYKYDLLQAWTYYYFYSVDNFERALDASNQQLALAYSMGDYDLIVQSKALQLIVYSFNFQNIQKGLELASEIKRDISQTLNPITLVESHNALWQFYAGIGDERKAQFHLLALIPIVKESGNASQLAGVYSALSLSFSRSNEFNLALEYAKNQIPIASNTGSVASIAQAHYDLGSIYFLMKQFQSANKHFSYSIELNNKLSKGSFYPAMLAKQLNVLAHTKGFIELEAMLNQLTEDEIKAIQTSDKWLHLYHEALAILFSAKDNYQSAYASQVKSTEALKRLSNQKKAILALDENIQSSENLFQSIERDELLQTQFELEKKKLFEEQNRLFWFAVIIAFMTVILIFMVHRKLLLRATKSAEESASSLIYLSKSQLISRLQTELEDTKGFAFAIIQLESSNYFDLLLQLHKLYEGQLNAARIPKNLIAIRIVDIDFNELTRWLSDYLVENPEHRLKIGLTESKPTDSAVDLLERAEMALVIANTAKQRLVIRQHR